MRLLEPSMGECIDRLSILARKIEERPEDAKHWQEEESKIIDYGGGLLKVSQIVRLAAVNAMIWEEMEKIAEDVTHPGHRAYLLNLRRAELVALLSGQKESKEKL